MAFHPKIYHLSDGDASSGKDIHLNFGKGTFNIAEYISIIPQDSFVTIETPRNESKGLIDFMEDVTYLRAVLT
jgi:endonuclease IV